MGTMQHNTIIATTWSEKHFTAVWDWVQVNAGELLPLFVSGRGIVNDQYTAVMLPDGSKEGWSHSELGDQLRAKFIERLKADAYEDGSNPWDYVDVAFGELGVQVAETNCEDVVNG